MFGLLCYQCVVVSGYRMSSDDTFDCAPAQTTALLIRARAAAGDFDGAVAAADALADVAKPDVYDAGGAVYV
jgi:hypothetical protein